MISRTPKTIPVFELTFIVALALIGWVALRLYEIRLEADEGRKQLFDLRTEYFRTSVFVQSTLNDLNTSFTNFLHTKNKVEMGRFELKSKEFQQWLEKENRRWTRAQPRLTNPPPQTPAQLLNATNRPAQVHNKLVQTLSEIGRGYTNYQRDARYLMANTGQPLIKARLASRELDLNRTRSSLLNLARQTQILGDALDLVLSGTQEGYGNVQNRFQRMGFALLLALVGLGFLLMLAIYRGKMAQTRQIIQQHKRQHLEQQAKLDKLANFGQLAQELAHEIKQPLTAITARVYTLQKLLPPGAETHKDAVVIRDEIKRLDRILKDFLELARPAEPKLLPVAAGQVVEDIRYLMGPQLEQEDIELKFDADEDLHILADAQQLKQVLINLVKNAAESLDRGGSITLRARKANRELSGADTEAVVLEVADTGPGIPPEIQDRIFDPFFSTKEDGTGLGLAIAAEIVDKHGGNLEFDTQPGKGTVFRIVLPACLKEQPA